MTKKEAREYFLKERNLLSQQEVKVYSEQIANQCKQAQLFQYQNYHVFISIKEKKEIDTEPIIRILWENNKKVYTSKVVGSSLQHYELTPHTQLKKSNWGILEPVNQDPVQIDQLDCVFMPLLAYDKKGNRVGYGKGYYDRFLTEYPQVKKVGLSIFPPINTIEDLSPTDIPLDNIVTNNYFSGFPIEEK